jgi:hypothetical protein
MFIDFNDMSEEGQAELIEYAEEEGVSVAELVEEFNELASDSDNVLDFFDNDNFLEQMLRDDSSLLEAYLLFVSAKVQKDAYRELVRRKH